MPPQKFKCTYPLDSGPRALPLLAVPQIGHVQIVLGVVVADVGRIKQVSGVLMDGRHTTVAAGRVEAVVHHGFGAVQERQALALLVRQGVLVGEELADQCHLALL